MTVLVSGATGKIGRELVPMLLDRGTAVRALTRDPASARVDPRAETVKADLDDPATLPPVLDGVDAVFVLTNGHRGEGLAQETHLATAAAKAGAGRLVKLSTTGVHFGGTDQISAGHRAAEEVIRTAGPSWTILQPGGFMDNRLWWAKTAREENAVHVFEAEGASVMIHARDIAAVAAEALTGPGHEGRTYQLTGGEVLTPADQAAALSAAVGRRLDLVVDTEADLWAQFQAKGWPRESFDGFVALKRGASGREAIVFDTVEALLGRAPLTFARWCTENAATFG
ncbi:SDR family oxidoreductase [Amycolatopsis minnesotensis]|uniref:NAD(P)H-binding protein n=1 Tax=Amycolatopsis minnesotensis TaxID=337894 RepID=A0ABP5E5Y9_9PSEU